MPVLSEIFEECPKVKILETFIENSNNQQYIAEIIRITKLPKMTVNTYVHKLLREDIIQKAGNAGKIQYYRLNEDNSKAQILLRFKQFIHNENIKESVRDDMVNDTKISTSEISSDGLNTPYTNFNFYSGL